MMCRGSSYRCADKHWCDTPFPKRGYASVCPCPEPLWQQWRGYNIQASIYIYTHASANKAERPMPCWSLLQLNLANM